jgi:hypothetical protein
MKKLYLILAFLMVSLISFATGETVVVDTNVGGGIASNPTQLGPVNPCPQLLFQVITNLPPDYVIVSKYEWFVNGVSTYVNTTDPGNSTFSTRLFPILLVFIAR